jgi:hypothetical protein
MLKYYIRISFPRTHTEKEGIGYLKSAIGDRCGKSGKYKTAGKVGKARVARKAAEISEKETNFIIRWKAMFYA